MHTQSRLYYLALAFLLLSQSTLGASPGLACPGCSLKTRQRGGPYENFNPWDDTDFDGTDSTTWLPDDYNGAPDFGSSVGETSGDLALLSAVAESTLSFDSFLSSASEPTSTFNFLQRRLRTHNNVRLIHQGHNRTHSNFRHIPRRCFRVRCDHWQGI